MYNLFLDESGMSSLTNQSTGLPHFSIAGIIVHEDSSRFINERARQIKFKYFNKTDVVFHAYDIINNEGDFKIFKNAQILKNSFIQDLRDFLDKANCKVVYAGVNKQKYILNNPTVDNLITKNIPTKRYEHALVKKMIKGIFKSYLCYLKNKTKHGKYCTGKITMEGAGEGQDTLCFSAYHSLLGGCVELNMINKDVRNFLTCISFATKKNNSVEVEIADMASYFLNLKHRVDDGVSKKMKKESEMLVEVLSKKLFINKCSGLPKDSWQDFSKMQEPPIGGSC